MTWVLMGVFVADMTFYFRILEMHTNQMDCLFASEKMIQKIGKPIKNYNLVCVPTDQIEGNIL